MDQEMTYYNRNIINSMVANEKAELLHLQQQRTKANKNRKPYWQAKIDAHFGLK